MSESELKWPDVEGMFGPEPMVAWDRDARGWMPIFRLRGVSTLDVLAELQIVEERVAWDRMTGYFATCTRCMRTVLGEGVEGYTLTVEDSTLIKLEASCLRRTIQNWIAGRAVALDPCWIARTHRTAAGLMELWADDAACIERVRRSGQRACRCVVWTGVEWRRRIDRDLTFVGNCD